MNNIKGSFKIPIDDFQDKPLQLRKSGSNDRLPVAHTCFYLIDLPDYQDKEVLKKKLITAIIEGYGGFHIQ